MGTTMLEGLTVEDSMLPVAVSGDLEAERHLTEQIDQLWKSHQAANGVIKNQKSAMRSSDETLAKMLYTMKMILSRPGRSGGWSEFLRDRKIPRSSGDRLVNHYQRTIGEEIAPGAITEPTEEEVQKVFGVVWPKLRRKLTTSQSVCWFISNLAAASGVGHEFRDGGIFVLNTPRETADETPTSTTLL